MLRLSCMTGESTAKQVESTIGSTDYLQKSQIMWVCVCVHVPGSQSSCERSRVWWVGRFHPVTRSSPRRGDAPVESLWFPGSKPALLPRPPKSEDWTNAEQTPQNKRKRFVTRHKHKSISCFEDVSSLIWSSYRTSYVVCYIVLLCFKQL